jgi:regulator of sigma E protease
MDTLLYSVLPFVGILVGLIVIHELGHYITAKMFGIKVLEAGLGYPPRVFGFMWKGTLYSFNWLPLGGFVRLLGEEDPTDPQSLAAQAAWKRMVVLAAGSFMNLMLPILLFAIAYMMPREVAVGPAVIDVVETGSPAAEAGLQSGDQIISLDGDEVKNSQDVGRAIRVGMSPPWWPGGDDTISFVVNRPIPGGGFERVEADVQARWAPPEGQGPTGIQISNKVSSSAICQTGDLPQCTETERYPIWEAIPKGWTATWDALILARNQVIQLFYGGEGPQVAGPVGIADATGDVVKEAGWKTLLDMAALLSINLAIINMLPLPMLDGGRFAFVVLEVIRRGKRVAPEKEAIVHLVGLALILVSALVITYFDVIRLIDGRSLFE